MLYVPLKSEKIFAHRKRFQEMSANIMEVLQEEDIEARLVGIFQSYAPGGVAVMWTLLCKSHEY